MKTKTIELFKYEELGLTAQSNAKNSCKKTKRTRL